MEFAQIDWTNWKSVDAWQNGGQTYSEYDADNRQYQYEEWQRALATAGATGWNEVRVSEDDTYNNAYGIDVCVSGDGQYLHVISISQSLGYDYEELFERIVTPALA